MKRNSNSQIIKPSPKPLSELIQSMKIDPKEKIDSPIESQIIVLPPHGNYGTIPMEEKSKGRNLI